MGEMQTISDRCRVQELPMALVDPWERNPRKITAESRAALRASLGRFGYVEPIIVNRRGERYWLVGGHQRAALLREDGVETVNCVVLDLPDREAEALAVTLNNHEAQGEWDESLGPLVEELRAAIGDQAALELRLNELRGELAPAAGLTDPDDVPDVTDGGGQVAKLGDLWQLGEHRLLCGDSTKAEHLDVLMGGDCRCDLCLTSPPYGVAPSAKIRDHYIPGAVVRNSFYVGHDDDPDSWARLMYDWSSLALSRCDAVACNLQMLATNKVAMIEWLNANRQWLCDVIVWDKVNAPPQMQKSVMSNAFEFVFLLGGNGSRSIPHSSWHGSVPNIFRYDPRGKNLFSDVHRAVFPVEFPLWMLKKVFDMAATVFDPFCGTGTTIIACEQLGRKCRAIEIEPKYVDVAVRRWEQFTGRQAVRIEEAPDVHQ